MRANQLGRTIAAFYGSLTVKGPHGASTIWATLPDWLPPGEIASMAAAALRANGKEIVTAGQLCEALSVAGPEEHAALQEKGLNMVQVMPTAEAVSEPDLHWDDVIV